MIDRKFIGHEFESFTTEVEKGRLKIFAKAIGETNPVFTDEQAAREAGYRALPIAPTFLMGLELDSPEFLPVLRVLEIDIRRILHGSQSFEYFHPICAGDSITIRSRIREIFEKKGGALSFVVIESEFFNQENELAARAENTLVHQN